MRNTITLQRRSKSKEMLIIIAGLLYGLLIKILPFLIAALGTWLLWDVVMALLPSDTTDHYIYHPYEVKYIVVTIGGVKKRVAVKRFLHRYKIIVKP